MTVQRVNRCVGQLTLDRMGGVPLAGILHWVLLATPLEDGCLMCVSWLIYDCHVHGSLYGLAFLTTRALNGRICRLDEGM